jgi:AcrR family transcriptional regulator
MNAGADRPETKERIRASAAESFHRKGYAATGIKEIVTNASAPFASLYHFYPGGKVELAETVIRTSGVMFQELVLAVWDAASDVQGSVHDIFAGAAMTLELTDYADACPIAVIALEVASTNEVLRVATDDVFTGWLAVLTDRLERAGIESSAAPDLAVSIIALLEGAFILARAARNSAPLHAAGASALQLVNLALAATS